MRAPTFFDAKYYRRFYSNPRTRVTTRTELAQRGTVIAAFVQQLDLQVQNILDAGCGLGWMRAPLLKAFPGARYVGLEISEHMCRKYGWIQRSLAEYRTRMRFDLIICNDVVQYLPDREAARALANLARLSRGALYLHVPTVEDWQDTVDHSCSDTEVYLRDAQWYRDRLGRHFRHAGFGIHVRRGVPWVQWELARAHAI